MSRSYTLPPRFYFDHVARDCASGVIVRETKRSVIVDLDREAYDDLLSDARYYADASQFDRDLSGLCASARATFRALHVAGPPIADHACPHCELPNVTGRGSRVCPSCGGRVS